MQLVLITVGGFVVYEYVKIASMIMAVVSVGGISLTLLLVALGKIRV